MRDLELPEELRALIASGAWPQSEKEANQQNLPSGPIPSELVQRLAPGELTLYLHPPPFPTIAELCARGARDFRVEFGSLDQIKPELALLIGDFGLGSDTAIALDYSLPGPPAVIRLAWGKGERRTSWKQFFPSFSAFAEAFGLARCKWR